MTQRRGYAKHDPHTLGQGNTPHAIVEELVVVLLIIIPTRNLGQSAC